MDGLPSTLPMPPCYYDCVKYDMAGVRSQSECAECSTWEAEFKAFAASHSDAMSSSQSDQDSSSSDSAYYFDRPECYAECLEKVGKEEGRMCDECDRFHKEEDAAIRESIDAIRTTAAFASIDTHADIPQPGVNRPLCWYTCFIRQSNGEGLSCQACQAVNVMNERLTREACVEMNDDRELEEQQPSRRVPLYLRRGLSNNE